MGKGKKQTINSNEKIDAARLRMRKKFEDNKSKTLNSSEIDNPVLQEIFRNNELSADFIDVSNQYDPGTIFDSLKNCYANFQIVPLLYPDNPMSLENHFIKLSILSGLISQQGIERYIESNSREMGSEDLYEYSTNLYGQKSGIVSPENIIQSTCKAPSSASN